MVQELELELEQSWQLPLTAAAIGGRALWKPSFSSENWIFVRLCLPVWCSEIIAIQKVLHNSLQISCLNWHVILIFETKFLSFWTWYWGIVLRSDKIGGDKQPVNTDPVVLKYSLCGACWASGWIFELKTWFLEETVWKVCARQVTRVYWSRFGGWAFTRLPTCALTCGSHQPPSHQRHQPAQVSGFPQAKVLQRPYMPLWCHCDAMVWQNLSTPHIYQPGSSSWSTFQYQKLRLQKWFHAACAFSTQTQTHTCAVCTLKSVKPQPEGHAEKSHHSLGYQRKGFFLLAL